MIIYTKLNNEEIVFMVPPIMEELTGSVFDRFQQRMTNGMYQYFSTPFVLLCNEITLYNFSTEQYLELKNRGNAIDKKWKSGTIASRLKNTFELGTFHNGKKFLPWGCRTDFCTITIDPNSTENLEEYLRALDEIYNFF